MYICIYTYTVYIYILRICIGVYVYIYIYIHSVIYSTATFAYFPFPIAQYSPSVFGFDLEAARGSGKTDATCYIKPVLMSCGTWTATVFLETAGKNPIHMKKVAIKTVAIFESMIEHVNAFCPFLIFGDGPCRKLLTREQYISSKWIGLHNFSATSCTWIGTELGGVLTHPLVIQQFAIEKLPFIVSFTIDHGYFP